MWGDGQWYPDHSGVYFYYDVEGYMIYYTGEYDDENDTANDFGQADYAQDQFMQASGRSGRSSIAPIGGKNRMSVGRPSLSRPPSMRVPAKQAES